MRKRAIKLNQGRAAPRMGSSLAPKYTFSTCQNPPPGYMLLPYYYYCCKVEEIIEWYTYSDRIQYSGGGVGGD